jgi:hypothetical protein
MTQLELLDTLDKGVQQSSMAKSFLTLDSLQCGTGLLGITILVAQFPQVYSPKIPIGISRKFFLIKHPNLDQLFL